MLEQYAETAYMGKQDAKFRDEIATDERDSMYCRYQSKQALFPRGSVLGHCFDSSQTLFYKDNLNGSAEDCRSLFEIDKKLKLAMNTIPANFIDFIIFCLYSCESQCFTLFAIFRAWGRRQPSPRTHGETSDPRQPPYTGGRWRGGGSFHFP